MNRLKILLENLKSERTDVRCYDFTSSLAKGLFAKPPGDGSFATGALFFCGGAAG